jgi:hypothetical protein
MGNAEAISYFAYGWMFWLDGKELLTLNLLTRKVSTDLGIPRRRCIVLDKYSVLYRTVLYIYALFKIRLESQLQVSLRNLRKEAASALNTRRPTLLVNLINPTTTHHLSFIVGF